MVKVVVVIIWNIYIYTYIFEHSRCDMFLVRDIAYYCKGQHVVKAVFIPVAIMTSTNKIVKRMNEALFFTASHNSHAVPLYFCVPPKCAYLRNPERKIMCLLLVTADIIWSICHCTLIGQWFSEEFSLDIGYFYCGPISWSVSKWIWDVELFKATLEGKCPTFDFKWSRKFLWFIIHEKSTERK